MIERDRLNQLKPKGWTPFQWLMAATIMIIWATVILAVAY